MKVRDLKDFFAIEMDELTLTKNLTAISHWVKRLRKAPDGMNVKDDELSTFKSLQDLKIVTLTKNGSSTHAELTEEGKLLYTDFFMHGYYEGGI